MNIAGRAAAVAPGMADNLSAFAGVYQTHSLPDIAGKPAEPGFELAVSVNSQGKPYFLFMFIMHIPTENSLVLFIPHHVFACI